MRSGLPSGGIYVLNLTSPALGHAHHTTGTVSPDCGRGTFHLYLVKQRKLTQFIIWGPSVSQSVHVLCAWAAQRPSAVTS